MSMNIFVGNLSFRMTEEDLQSLFSNQGEVSSVRIIKDRNSGLSKGFGFVEMADAAAAQTAIDQLNGHEILGRAIRVNEAQAKTENSRDNSSMAGGSDRRFSRPRSW